MPKGARKQMTEEQEYIYENTKLIPDTLSLIEKELEKSIKESERLDKSIKELRKKRLAKKKSKKEESSSDSSSDSSSSSSSSSSESKNNLRRLSKNDHRRVVKNKGLIDIIKKLKFMTGEKISKVKYKKLDCLNYRITEFIKEFLFLIDVFQITTKQMDISNKLITKELDLSIFKNLEELDCSNNSIVQIILPKSLKKLKCLNNDIERLDIQDSQIEHLECDIDSIENINKLPKSLIYLFLGGDENDYGQVCNGNDSSCDYGFNFKYVDKYKIEIVLSVNSENKIIPKLKELLDQVKQIQTDKIIIFHMYECYEDIFYRSDRFLNKLFKSYEEDFDEDFDKVFDIYVPYIKNKILKQLEKFYLIKINNLEYHGFKG